MVIDRLKSIVSEYTGIRESEIHPDLSLRGDMALDSFQIIAMISSIEYEFGIVIPESDMMEFDVLQDVADFIESQARRGLPNCTAGAV